MMIRLFRLLLPLTLIAGCAAGDPPTAAAPVLQRAPGAVSAADPRAAEAGRQMLAAGGSATDAAIAIAFALTVVEPQSSGIGGGGFLVHHDGASGAITSYDGRETAPMAAGPALFLGPDGAPLPIRDAVPGGKSVGVPGNVRMFARAHAAHGRLPWARLFEPAIALARDGFEVTPRLHEFLTSRGRSAALSPFGKALFFAADGQPVPVGHRLRNPELAATLTRIARHGPDAFYVGPVAEAIAAAVRTAPRNPAAMTPGDLAAYAAAEREVPCGTYRGHRICGMGPPASGAIAVFAILKQLERFDLAAMGPSDPRTWHLIAESMRLAYADRDAFVADPDFVPVPISGLMDPAYLAARSALIRPDARLPAASPGSPAGAPPVVKAPALEPASTSHMVAVDAAGNVASLTSTIEGPFGSGLTAAGFYLNNELTDFSLAPVRDGALVANRVEGGKRPRSSMSPTIVYGPDGAVRLALGAAGGSTIIAQVAKTVIAVVDWGLPVERAIAAPQLYANGDTLVVERGTALEAMIPALAALGHQPVARALPLKGNAVEWRDGQWIGGADRRSEGAAFRQ
jgi:gamma-glutamyltranspeptidase/glutathione hydrolase